MRYTDKEGKTLNLDDCMTADSFFMEAEVYICEPLEMHFNKEGDLRAGKKPNKAIAHLPSHGSELTPPEVQTLTYREDGKLLNVPLATGYTVDNQAMINNYTIQPAMSLAKYPSTEQQQRYIFQRAVAIVFVALTLLTALAVS